jgi:uncharacterized protein with HEPN domain
MSPRLWRHRIQDILDAIAKITSYVEGMDLAAFRRDAKTIDAVIRNLIVMGEAAKGVPADVRDAHPELPWRLMADLRNFAVHEYWGVALPTIMGNNPSRLAALGPGFKGSVGRRTQ